MKRGFRYTRRRAAAAAISTGLLICSLALRAGARSGNAARLRADRDLEQAAMARLESLSGYDNAHLEAVRAKADRFRLALGGTATLEGVIKSLGVRWVRQSEASTEHGSYTTRTERLAMTSPTPEDWPGIVAAVEAIEKLPGAGVRQLELKASDGAMDQASMVLVVEAARDAPKQISR